MLFLLLRGVRFLPNTWPGHVCVADEEDEPKGRGRGRQEASGPLDLAMWLMAWERYSLAAVITKQVCAICVSVRVVELVVLLFAKLSYAQCIKHKYVIAELAAEAGPHVAVTYDELLRFEWEDLSCKLGCRYDFAAKVDQRSEKVLRQAHFKLERGGVPPPAAVAVSSARQQPSRPSPPPPPPSGKRPVEAPAEGGQDSKRRAIRCYRCHNKVHKHPHLAKDCPENKRAGGHRPVGSSSYRTCRFGPLCVRWQREVSVKLEALWRHPLGTRQQALGRCQLAMASGLPCQPCLVFENYDRCCACTH